MGFDSDDIESDDEMAAAIAELDQHQAKAIDLLKQSEQFFLVALEKEAGEITTIGGGNCDEEQMEAFIKYVLWSSKRVALDFFRMQREERKDDE